MRQIEWSERRFEVGDMVRSKIKYQDQNGSTGVVVKITRDCGCLGHEPGIIMGDGLTIYWSHGELTRVFELDVETIK